jgi:uncharacterized phage-associated protein
MATTNVIHVAAFILRQTGTLTTMKLQKLIYYGQAWSLVWDGEPLFQQPIEAWANGPIVRELYDLHAGKYEIDLAFLQARGGDPDALTASQQETIQAVLHYYGQKPSQWLSDLTHSERPWRETRQGLSDRERGYREISLAAMAEYYEGVYNEGVEVEA